MNFCSFLLILIIQIIILIYIISSYLSSNSFLIQEFKRQFWVLHSFD